MYTMLHNLMYSKVHCTRETCTAMQHYSKLYSKALHVSTWVELPSSGDKGYPACALQPHSC